MKISDFRCMRNGKPLSDLTEQNAALIKPFDIRKGQGNKKALLLFHGFSSTPGVYRLLQTELSKHYDAIICPALQGHAESIALFSKAKAKGWMLQAEEIYDNVAKEFEMVDVLGLSLGGLLACHLAAHFPVHHLFLLAPALNLRMNIKLGLTLAKTLDGLKFSTIRNAAGNLYSQTNCEWAYRELPIKTIIEVLSFIKEFPFALPNCPTDLFLGEHDLVVDSDRVAERFVKKEDIHIHYLQNSAHVLPLDGDIDFILSQIQGRSIHV